MKRSQCGGRGSAQEELGSVVPCVPALLRSFHEYPSHGSESRRGRRGCHGSRSSGLGCPAMSPACSLSLESAWRVCVQQTKPCACDFSSRHNQSSRDIVCRSSQVGSHLFLMSSMTKVRSREETEAQRLSDLTEATCSASSGVSW